MSSTDTSSAAIAIAMEVAKVYTEVLRLIPDYSQTPWGITRAFLCSRLFEFHQAAVQLCECEYPRPVAIIVLARAQYESYLHLEFILHHPDEVTRQSLAKQFVKFGEYQHVEAIGDDDDRISYRLALSGEQQNAWDRRVAMHQEVRNNFSADQRKQGFGVTWDGKSIRKRAEVLGIVEKHDQWYGIMCLVAHGSMAVFEKSVSFGEEKAIILGQADSGKKDATEWMLRMSRVLLVAASKLRLDIGAAQFESRENELFVQLRRMEFDAPA